MSIIGKFHPGSNRSIDIKDQLGPLKLSRHERLGRGRISTGLRTQDTGDSHRRRRRVVPEKGKLVAFDTAKSQNSKALCSLSYRIGV